MSTTDKDDSFTKIKKLKIELELKKAMLKGYEELLEKLTEYKKWVRHKVHINSYQTSFQEFEDKFLTLFPDSVDKSKQPEGNK